MRTDTHAFLISQDVIEPQIRDGTGYSETFKVVADDISISGQIFTGSPSEDDIDLVNRHGLFIGPNAHGSSAPQSITIKGGASAILIKGYFKKVVLGQYSNYDRWFRGKRTEGIFFDSDASGVVEVWYATLPAEVPPGVKIKDCRWKVWPYFLWRSIQQTFNPPN